MSTQHRFREQPAHRLPSLIGESAASRELRAWIDTVGRMKLSKLITGESGTGKELVAGHLHRVSARGPFVTVNCAAMPEHLFESELFGHVRGAFTGAHRDKPGLFHEAHGGSIFLDEIGELAPSLQAKLLRVLETGEVRRVGANTYQEVDVWLIAATNRDLERDVRHGRFREDLYYRVTGCGFHIAPLRERPADIRALAGHFADPAAISPQAISLLEMHPWPGNVRQLKSALGYAAHQAAGAEIQPEHFAEGIRIAALRTLQQHRNGVSPGTLETVVRDHILSVYEQSGRNGSVTAKILGISRWTLRRRLSEYGCTCDGANLTSAANPASSIQV